MISFLKIFPDDLSLFPASSMSTIVNRAEAASAVLRSPKLIRDDLGESGVGIVDLPRKGLLEETSLQQSRRVPVPIVAFGF